jgi:hypothetical protein
MFRIRPLTLKPVAAPRKLRLALITVLVTGITLSAYGCQSPQQSTQVTPASPVGTQASMTPQVVQSSDSGTSSSGASDSGASAPASPVSQTNQASDRPTIGTVEELQNGDLACYITLVDDNNVKHEGLPASFDFCAEEKTYLHQRVRPTYEQGNLADCQSNEPCGKTRRAWIITKLEVLNASTPATTDSETYTNGEWTITISNLKSWSGVNGTGNLNYRGCDSRGKCLSLRNGKLTSRNGMNSMGWRNGEYFYIVEMPISSPDNPTPLGTGTQLTVLKGDKVILHETGFKAVSH